MEDNDIDVDEICGIEIWPSSTRWLEDAYKSPKWKNNGPLLRIFKLETVWQTSIPDKQEDFYEDF